MKIKPLLVHRTVGIMLAYSNCHAVIILIASNLEVIFTILDDLHLVVIPLFVCRQPLVLLAITIVRKWSNNYAYTIAISNGCICNSYVILVLVVMS